MIKNTKELIVEILLEYLMNTNAIAVSLEKLPLDQSLYEIGVLDSFGVIEIVEFIEQKWSIRILDSEITNERFGGINKMANLILEKLSND